MAARGYGQRYDIWVAPVTATAMLISHLFYLPIHLAVFRLYTCEPSVTGTMVLSADGNVVCGSTWHIVFIVICTVLIVPTTFGLPYLIHRSISDAKVYVSQADQEKR